MSSPGYLLLFFSISCVSGEFCEQRKTEFTNFESGFDTKTDIINCPEPQYPEHFTRCCGPFWERKCCAPVGYDPDFDRLKMIVGIVFGVVAFLMFGSVCLCACLPCCALAKLINKRSGGGFHQPVPNVPTHEGVTYHPQSDYPPQGGPPTPYKPSVGPPTSYPHPVGPPASYPAPGGPPNSYQPPGRLPISYPATTGGPPVFNPPGGPPVFNPPEGPTVFNPPGGHITSYLPPGELSTYNPSHGVPYEPIQAYSDPPPYGSDTRQQPFNPYT